MTQRTPASICLRQPGTNTTLCRWGLLPMTDDPELVGCPLCQEVLAAMTERALGHLEPGEARVRGVEQHDEGVFTVHVDLRPLATVPHTSVLGDDE